MYVCIYVVWVQEYFLPHILSKVQYICTCIYSDFCPLWQSREGMNHHFDTNFMSDYSVHINKSFTIIFYKRYQNLFKHLVGYYLVHSGYVAEDISGTKCLNLFTLKVAIGQPNDLVSHIGKHQITLEITGPMTGWMIRRMTGPMTGWMTGGMTRRMTRQIAGQLG